jgi:hypothetical protein
VHAQAFGPTWRSRVVVLVATWDRNTRKQRQTAHWIAAAEAHQRIGRHHNPSAGQQGRGPPTSERFPLVWGARQERIPPKTDPPGRGNPGGSR